MYPPIFAICKAASAVAALIGSSPMRLYQFGKAPPNVVKPYAVWQTIGGSPDNYIGSVPDHDLFSIQIDVYSTTDISARAVAEALRDAIEPVAYIVRWGGESVDTETGSYRYSFDVDWIVKR